MVTANLMKYHYSEKGLTEHDVKIVKQEQGRILQIIDDLENNIVDKLVTNDNEKAKFQLKLLRSWIGRKFQIAKLEIEGLKKKTRRIN